MSKTAATTNKSKSPQELKAIRNNPFNILMQLTLGVTWDIIKYLLYSIFLGIFIEWVGMATTLLPANHAEQVLRTEFAYLGDNFSTTVFGISAKDAALVVVRTLNSYLRHGVSEASSASMLSVASAKSFSNWSIPYINAVIYIMMVTGIRCVIIILSIALFLIVGVAATVDGWHVRELRKVGGDDEHGDVYHWSKASVPKIIILSPFIYLAWPGAINPNFILLPGMLLLFIAVFLVVSKYKKVL